MNSDLNWTRLEELRADFAKVTGKPFEHFYCPILLTDEPGELCNGHIVPEAFGNLTIPQRKDVDNFYGTAVEADFVGLMQDKKTDVMAFWHTPSVHRRLQPRIESADGKTIGHYFPTKEVEEVPGHTVAELRGPDGKTIQTIVFKMPPQDVMGLEGQGLQVVVDRNFMPQVVAAVLKAAHLSMFYMLRYEYVFSPIGLYLADILKRFFLDHKDSKNKKQAVNDYFMPYCRMTFPLEGDAGSLFAGTVNDKRGLLCWGMSGRPFAMGIIVKMPETFCALLPPDNADGIGTYLSFLKEPPASIALREFCFNPGSDTEQSHWGFSPADYRVEVPR